MISSSLRFRGKIINPRLHCSQRLVCVAMLNAVEAITPTPREALLSGKHFRQQLEAAQVEAFASR